MTVKDLMNQLRQIDSDAVVMLYDTINLRVLPVVSVVEDQYLSQDKLQSRLRVINTVNLKPGQKIARLSY